MSLEETFDNTTEFETGYFQFQLINNLLASQF